jgi:Flp pilus assembly protein TadD
LLEALAADRIEGRDSAGAAALLERAARLAPDRAAPWLTIGILFERDRVLDRARAAFDRVLAIEPGHREARLRRARVDLLAGRDEAGDELERLASERLDWIGVVAAEERTRQLLAAGRDEAAIEFLLPLVEAAPGEASLARALAYALERTGRRLAAREHVARSTAATSRPGTTPRKRYAEAPERLLLDRRVEVERAALLALPDLASALGAGEGNR